MIYNDNTEVGKLIIQLAPTGAIPKKEDNPFVPIQPDEIIADTIEAYKMGVSSVHIHARNEDGLPIGSRVIYQEIMKGIRRNCPDIIICTSTGGRIFEGERDSSLDLYPDMASLSLGSVTFKESVSVNSFDIITRFAGKMSENGVKPELEIFDAGFINTAKYLEKHKILCPPLHFNLILGSLGSIPADISDLVYLTNKLPVNSTWSATGIGRFQTQISAAAIIMGGHVRIGIEDSPYADHRKKQPITNKELIQKVIDLARVLGREIASPGEARRILHLNPHPWAECSWVEGRSSES